MKWMGALLLSVVFLATGCGDKESKEEKVQRNEHRVDELNRIQKSLEKEAIGIGGEFKVELYALHRSMDIKQLESLRSRLQNYIRIGNQVLSETAPGKGLIFKDRDKLQYRVTRSIAYISSLDTEIAHRANAEPENLTKLQSQIEENQQIVNNILNQNLDYLEFSRSGFSVKSSLFLQMTSQEKIQFKNDLQLVYAKLSHSLQIKKKHKIPLTNRGALRKLHIDTLKALADIQVLNATKDGLKAHSSANDE